MDVVLCLPSIPAVQLPREGRGQSPGVPRRRLETRSWDFRVAGNGVTRSTLEVGLVFTYVWPQSSFTVESPSHL